MLGTNGSPLTFFAENESMETQSPIVLNLEEAKKFIQEKEGCKTWFPRHDENGKLIGWRSHGSGKPVYHFPLETFDWVPHYRETWPFRYMTAKVPIPYQDYRPQLGGGQPITREFPVGTRVKIVMVSRFGDVGITDDLSKDHGYEVRGLEIKTLSEKFENFSNEP